MAKKTHLQPPQPEPLPAPAFPPKVRAFTIFQAVQWAKKNRNSRFVLLGEHHKAVQDAFRSGAEMSAAMGRPLRAGLTVALLLALVALACLLNGCAGTAAGNLYDHLHRDRMALEAIPGVKAAADKYAPWVPAVRAALDATYVVTRGDSLWTVSKKAYGDGRLWPALMKDVGDPDYVYAGQTLTVPQALSAEDVNAFRFMAHAHFVSPQVDPVLALAPPKIEEVLARPLPATDTAEVKP